LSFLAVALTLAADVQHPGASPAGIPGRINRIATAALIIAASRNKSLVCAQDVLDARLDRGRA
jgi:type II secretory pathway predicted ATPase ExeA